MPSKTVVILEFDGACEPVNPGGVASGGWIIRRPDTSVEIKGSKVFCEGPGATNNYAEWCALGCGLRAMLDNREKFDGCELEIYGDSQLVIKQLLWQWNCNKEHLQVLRARCESIIEELNLPRWSATWIPREENHEADALSRLAYENATGQKFPERRKVHGSH